LRRLENRVESPRGEEIADGKGIGYNPGRVEAGKPHGGERMRARALVVTGLLAAVAAACGRAGAGGATPPVTAEASRVATVCDERAQLVQSNRLYREEMPPSAGPYPDNCLYYCVVLREPAGNLRIDVRDASADLDLFVGLGSIEALSGEALVEGETYTWKSNQPGNDDERVEVDLPEAGTYYLEVCSYEGESTPFELEVGLR
jgi:hypothetical protein